jgi:hypothetical protein
VDLLESLMRNTQQRSLLDTSVGTVMERVRRGWKKRPDPTPQVDEHSPEWKLLRELLPEALDPVIRSELMFYGALPAWAK